MCSVNEEDLDVMPEQPTNDELLSDMCKKCSNKGSIVLRKRDVYCVHCFVAAVNHKFRASLGKNKTIRANEKVAIAVSGGLSSSVLLNFTHNGLSEDTHKKLRIEAVCIHIYDDLSQETALKNYTIILEQCKQYGMPLYVTNMSDCIDENVLSLTENLIPPINTSLQKKLQSSLQHFKSPTSLIDFVSKLRRKLLLRCAEKLGCSFILSAEISTSLASSMLSNITLGRGAQIENDVGYCDSRDTIKILRPIKDLTFEEAKLYAELKNVVFHSEDVSACDSIQKTIGKFVNDLQENFPATISTICKTGEKMGTFTKVGTETDECILCQSSLDTQEVKSSALQATEFSRLVSATGPDRDPAAATAGDSKCSGCHCSKKVITRNDIEMCLCYGCRLIIRDISEEHLAEYFESIVKNKLAMNKLRIEINDFLI